ncbi:hypothetical protein [Bradyrhizobium vignae]|uniref:hypothetical protein n=1 Tax=Bradyrhizobium vignae TaxID=1549949 RepID=UPI001FD831F4|nr:hypothetical protein [Bradyrhizobium vignae]
MRNSRDDCARAAPRSVGSAIFAAALHADNAPLDTIAPDAKPCPKIADFLAGVGPAEDIDAPGQVQQRVASVLETDFLSPLAAGFLFTDFTQLFSPRSLSQVLIAPAFWSTRWRMLQTECSRTKRAPAINPIC